MSMSNYLGKIGVSFKRLTVDGQPYLVTTGTGEGSYGSNLGGDAAFAYYADDGTDKPIDSYSDFCDVFTPVEDKKVAIEAAKIGLRLTKAGACRPVLSDEEFLSNKNSEILL